MLAEILCDKFIDDGEPRGPIRFKQGLNAVLGDERATNSIGKSTFLLAIDYAFGGNTYARFDNSLLKEIGQHDIKFTHRLKEIDYQFTRSTADQEVVCRCHGDYEPYDEMSLEEFRAWLASAYGMDNLGGGFRYLVGPFFRIYGKHNLDEAHPLQAHPSESLATGVDRLIKLYDKHGAIVELERTLKDIQERQRAFRLAEKFDFVRAASNRKELQRNEQRIDELSNKLGDLVRTDHDNLDDLEPIKAERLADLKSKLSECRRQRTRLQSRLTSMKNDLDLVKFSKTKDFSNLLRFFPNASLKNIVEIEEFHTSIVGVLKDEHNSISDAIKSQIQTLDKQIENLEADAREIGSLSNLTEAVLKSYASLSHEIQQLKDANEAYEEENGFREQANITKQRLDESVESASRSIEFELNTRLRELNSAACGKSRSAPRIHIKSRKCYEFEVPLDAGTGSNIRGMVLLDLALLNQTPIPAVVHDSVCLKHIEDDVLVNLFDLYDDNQKQVFIALDKASSYSSTGDIPKILKDSTVLHLKSGHELFGKYWATEEAADIQEANERHANNDDFDEPGEID